MLQLRHSVPEVETVNRALVVNLSSDRRAGNDMAAKLKFWSQTAHVEVTNADGSASGPWDLVILVHDGLLYRRDRRLRRAVRSFVTTSPLVVAVDVTHQRVYRVDRQRYSAFAHRARAYPYLLAIARRLPAPLRRPFFGTR